MGWQAWFTTLTGDPEQTLAITGKVLTGDYLHTGIEVYLTGEHYLTCYAICAWFSKLYLM